MRHLVLTGVRQSGKSTLADRYLAQTGQRWAGYRTKVRERTQFGPIYEMQDLLTGQAEPISRLDGEQMAAIPETFDGFGAQLLRRALSSDAPILLLDEIGRFERSSPLFLAAVMDTFVDGRQVVAVLKKEKLPYLDAIKAREDVVVVDLDTMSREAAWSKIREDFLK